MTEPNEELQTEVDSQEKSNDILQLVCFKLANEEYALDINLIQEVIKFPKLTPVPQMPSFCLGVVNSRGNVIPVFDLRRKFRLPDKEFDSETRLLVAIVDHMVISMVVDEVLDNIKFESSQIDPAPSVKMNIDREYIKGLGELPNRMIVILDLEKMHENIKSEINAHHLKPNETVKI